MKYTHISITLYAEGEMSLSVPLASARQRETNLVRFRKKSAIIAQSFEDFLNRIQIPTIIDIDADQVGSVRQAIMVSARPI